MFSSYPNFGTYKVTTTQVVIQTPAKDSEAAMQIVMDSELCPRSAILSVIKQDQSLRLCL
jgi:hypothetical protein